MCEFVTTRDTYCHGIWLNCVTSCDTCWSGIDESVNMNGKSFSTCAIICVDL